MTWKTLFFGFDGRIGRKQWWMAILPLVLVSMTLSFLVNPHAWIFDGNVPPSPNAAETLISLAFLIPETAVSVKRFNDRDWSQWLPYSYAFIAVIFILFDHFRLIWVSEVPTRFDLAFSGALIGIGIVVIMQNGFLRGTPGPNRYGSDPLANDATSPTRVLHDNLDRQAP